MTAAIDRYATKNTRRRYDRIAPFYDRLLTGIERRFSSWRTLAWQRVEGPLVLEVGVGTGKNMPFYPEHVEVFAIDLSSRMLEQARSRANRLGVSAQLCQADAQALPFPDATFDTAIATDVFCSVPNPLLGLLELRRVLKPGGQLLLLDHVLSQRPVIKELMQLVNPVVNWAFGANIDRKTIETVREAGFRDIQIEDLSRDIFKLIEARSPAESAKSTAE